jgi:hypothetical protein
MTKVGFFSSNTEITGLYYLTNKGAEGAVGVDPLYTLANYTAQYTLKNVSFVTITKGDIVVTNGNGVYKKNAKCAGTRHYTFADTSNEETCYSRCNSYSGTMSSSYKYCCHHTS